MGMRMATTRRKQTMFLFLFSIAILGCNRMKPNRNGPCPCGSDKKFKHCCIDLYNERIRWDGLEDSLRNKVDEFWKEFYYDKYIEGASNIYGEEDIEGCEDVPKRRLFFDWFIHDYNIPDKRDTVIRLFIKEYENRFIDELERNTAIAWSNSAFRFFEILDIKRGFGYKVRDLFNEGNELFIYDKSSSETVKKYDIQYIRLYPVGNITRIGGGGLLLSRRHLPYIKNYVSNSAQKFNFGKINSIGEQNSHVSNNLDNYLRAESLSIIKYLESLTLRPTLTTSQGDIAVLSRSSFVIKNKRRLISLLNSSKDFTKLESYGRVTRYDWVEALSLNANRFKNDDDKENQYQKEEDFLTGEQIALDTIAWVPQSDEVESKSNSIIKNEAYVPYRVLGNLSISGKNLIIECLSDKLHKNCNEIIQSLAGKYLTHIGDMYKELSDSSTQTENEDYYYDDNDDYHLDIHDEEAEAFKQQIDDYFQNYYEDWVTMKIPALENLTPMEVSKTEKGRERLKEVLRQIENELARCNDKDVYPFPIEKISKRLGL